MIDSVISNERLHVNDEEEKLIEGGSQITNLHVDLGEVRNGWGLLLFLKERWQRGHVEKLHKKSLSFPLKIWVRNI